MIQFICFSRRRPLQLHAYISSLFWRCGEGVALSVLVRIDAEYASAYAEIRERFPYVHFVEETDFELDLKSILQRSSGELTCFGCDDVVFVAPLSETKIQAAFDTEVEDMFGMSLRMGQNITRDMFGANLSQPEFIKTGDGKWLVWDMTNIDSHGDWAYPWEVLGTVYRTEFVDSMVSTIIAHNPSQLEANGAQVASATLGALGKPLMASYLTSRIVVPTVNIVQNEFPGNGIRLNELSPEFLLDCWHKGFRVNTTLLSGISPPSWRIGDFHIGRTET